MVGLKKLLAKILAWARDVESYIIADSHYSTNEVFTGHYGIDGKKIYRRVLTKNLPTTSGGNDTGYSISSGNLKQAIFINGFFSGTDGRQMTLQWPDATASNYNTVCTIRNNYISIGIGASCNGMGTPITIIIEYTKTTD